MIDRQGRVTARFFDDYYWERNTASTIMPRPCRGAIRAVSRGRVGADRITDLPQTTGGGPNRSYRQLERYVAGEPLRWRVSAASAKHTPHEWSPALPLSATR